MLIYSTLKNQSEIITFKEKSCSGGGSTFIAYNNQPNNILIASGSGGGSGSYLLEEYIGGYGGKIAGNGNGSIFYSGKGATYSTAGAGGVYSFNPDDNRGSCTAESGSKLAGGNSCITADASPGGGGGGYYGGGGGADVAGGGGGSSFASNILEKVLFKNGNEEIFEPDGTKSIGHVGNGFISIEHYMICSNLWYNIYFLAFHLNILFIGFFS
ncbi:eggshell protein 1 precursor, putative [Trichomonas vaginalis G3]|uniref:receptor protein-tyrosine kinase n=1 Tax=Trichomonas vaginalis (strain ATCC PRA-98 / G3) TaxID=412133 RepID=A2EH50_TRIV3|nr:glycine-rich protein family [Trichomonas vaginalis G3]EAY08018.1 eggshell protein 1 precursor, putative [Trichomonas vaginalis G3]KAI5537358.1 glycine-rich protein family [Trichomonas vaginalis G3]|eukprot:XP_001320241.1 eggshell protein 1 precursor [Trichomonas vaginalis G3]